MGYNDDAFINIVNDNADKKRILEETSRKSIVNDTVRYSKDKKKIKKDFKSKTVLYLLIVGLGIGAMGLQVTNDRNKLSENTDIFMEAHEVASFVSDETYRVNNNTAVAYDNFDIAKKVLNYEGKEDINAVIYSCYKMYSYNVLTQMDKLFSNMHLLIEGNETNFSKEIVDSCNYSSFSDYLDALNFSTIDEYKELMEDLLLAYSRNGNESEEVKSILDIINSQGIEFGGR
ncbi:MAG: hypothetical protein RSE41_10315 [Clostridia bacterium]